MTRARGTGSIEVLPSGKARITFVVGRRKSRKTFASEQLALAALDALNLLQLEGSIRPPGGETFGELFERFMTARELGGLVRAIDSERRVVAAHVCKAPFWNLSARSVRRRDVAAWVDALLGTRAVTTIQTKAGPIRRQASRTLARGTVQNALRLVQAALAFGVQRDELPANVAAAVRVRRHVRAADTADPWTFLTLAEIDMLLGSDLSKRDRALLALAIYAGPRLGEILGLRWEDVHESDEERPRVVLRRGRQGPTKSGKVREVPLFLPARLALASWRDGATEGLVFPNPSGGVYSDTYDAGWSDKRQRRGPRRPDGSRELVTTAGLKTRAGIARHVRFHDLRHTCGSHLIMGSWGQTWELAEIRDFLGHSTIRMTERYAHLGADSIHAKARTAFEPTRAHEGPGRAAFSSAVSQGSRDDRRDRDRTCDQRGVNTPDSPCFVGSDGPVGSPWALAEARAVVLGVAGGELAREQLAELARVVLEHAADAPAELVRLALEVREGGPHATRRAIELAALVLAPVAPAAATKDRTTA